MDLKLKRMYEPTEKVALQIHSWQVDANIFKVMRYSLLRDFYLVSLFFVALQITTKSKNHGGMHCALL